MAYFYPALDTQRLREANFEEKGYLGRGIFIVMCQTDKLKRRLDTLSGQIQIGDLNIYPQLIVGAARWPEHSSNFERLVRRAETALAVAKAHNRDWVMYEKTLEPDELSIKLATDFRASAGKGIFPVLQPQVDLKTGKVVAAEALVRWQHPELGVVSPAKFVPILEKAGLIGQITRKMLENSVRLSRNLTEVGVDCVISVNVSAQDVIADGLVDFLTDELARHAVLPRNIKLELTETSIAEDMARMQAVLEELDTLGVRVSIDDFGTGYSSLSYLSALPVYELKVDQSFVRGMATDRRDYNIVSSTIALGHSLGLKVVAEGAEDQETVRLLRELGCDKVQGYVFARPMAENEFLGFVTNWASQALAAR